MSPRPTQLNQLQQVAAQHLDGPALVLAGPGTGKTTTLVGRCCHLLTQGVPAKNILVSTFTRDAARQLVDRVSAQAGDDAANMRIGTFHGLCFRWLRDIRILADRAGLAPNWKLVEGFERSQIMKALVGYKSGLGEPSDVLEAIDRLKGQLITAEHATRLATKGSTLVSLELATAYARYQKALQENQRIDFGDMLVMTVRGFQEDHELRAKLSSRFRYVLIDEYQDVNAAQVELIDLLLDQHQNLWAVGDDDQAIYGWRGSDSKYTLEFGARHPGAKVIRLTENYRSEPSIIGGATALIQANKARMEKTLCPTRDGDRPILVCNAKDEGLEALWICERIAQAQKEGVECDGIAILVRISALMPTIEGALRGAGIPFEVKGKSFWNRSPVRTLLAALHMHIFVEPSPEWRLASDYYLRDLPTHSRGSVSQSVVTVAKHIVGRLPSSMAGERRVEWIGAIDQVVKEAEKFDAPHEFFEHARAMSDESPGSANEKRRVILATIHSAKGLEWSHVVLVGCDDGILPHVKAENMEEERRLAYVAMTRAKDQLYVTWALTRGQRSVSRSRFLNELLALAPRGMTKELWFPEDIRPTRQSSPTRKPLRKKPTTPIRPNCLGMHVGERVTHKIFGTGRVVAVGESNKLTVRFSSGPKTLKAKFLSKDT